MVSDELGLAKGAIDLGLGIYTYIQNETTLRDVWDDLTASVGDVNKNVKAMQGDIAKVLDNQASLLALFKQDYSDIYERSDSLESKVTEGFEAVIASIDNKEAEQAARTYKEKVQMVTFAYNELVADTAEAVGKDKSQQSLMLARSMAQDNAAKAEKRAEKLYAWAMTFLPNLGHGDTSSQARVLSKQQKLGAMPYIVAMTYAVRVKMDARMVKSHSMNNKDDQEVYLARSCRDIKEFVDLLRVVVKATVRDTSLLEMALELHLPVATYMMIMGGMQASVQVMAIQGPKTTKSIKYKAWDDGLSKIGSLVCQGADGIISIELDSSRKRAWWLSWIGLALGDRDIDDLTRAVPVRDLCLILGATRCCKEGTSFHLVPEYESTLFDLPSARLLRDTFLNKLAAALDTSPSSLQSAARIRSAGRIATPFERRKAPLQPLSPPLVHTLNGHFYPVYGVAVSSDGQRIVSASWDDMAKVWSAATGEKLRSFKKHIDCVNCVALFSDNRRAVTGSFDYTLRIWNINTGRQIRVFKGHSDDVFAVAVSPDGCTLASASRDRTIKLWNVHSGHSVATLIGHCDSVVCVAWSADGKTLASGSCDNTIKVWSAVSHCLLRTIEEDQGGHTNIVLGVAFAGDVLVSCSGDETIKVWNWQSGTLQTTLSEYIGLVCCVAVFPDNERVALGGYDKTIHIWNLRSGECEHILEGHQRGVMSVAVSRDGRTLVSGSMDKSVKVWTLRT